MALGEPSGSKDGLGIPLVVKCVSTRVVFATMINASSAMRLVAISELEAGTKPLSVIEVLSVGKIYGQRQDPLACLLAYGSKQGLTGVYGK